MMVLKHVGEAKGTKIIKIRLVVRPNLMMIKAAQTTAKERCKTLDSNKVAIFC